MAEKDTPLTYKQSGVDISAGDRLVERIKPLARATGRAGVASELGGFGGLFDLKAEGFVDPVLVSGTDGVGTKLMLAFETGRHETIGIDLVAMCANDVLAQGAEPLFFLDYFATGKLDEGVAEAVVSGIAAGCAEAGCALIGGETAEMPGMYPAGHYDLAGFVVGAVERELVLPRTGDMKPGDALIALPSSGPHSNGYSLIRKVVERSGIRIDAPAPFDPTRSLGEALLTPTKLYQRDVQPLLRKRLVKGLAHITGGGLPGNVPRMLPAHLSPEIDWSSWKRSELFNWLQTEGRIEDEGMAEAFNLGVGMVLLVARSDVDDVLALLENCGAWLLGQAK